MNHYYHFGYLSLSIHLPDFFFGYELSILLTLRLFIPFADSLPRKWFMQRRKTNIITIKHFHIHLSNHKLIFYTLPNFSRV